MCLGSNLGKIIRIDTLPGETVAGLTTDVDDEFESDWLKLLRRSSFSRVRNPSILMIFLQPNNKGKPLKITGFTLPSHVTMNRQTTHTCKKWQIKNLLKNNCRPCADVTFIDLTWIEVTKNPTIYNIMCWFAGTPKRLMFQALFFFFKFFIDLGHSKLFIFIFCKYMKK